MSGTGERADEHAQQPSLSSAHSSHTSAEPPLVLIVDDEAPIAEALAFIVRDVGCSPSTASNGQQALELARAHWPALVLTDLMMPILDGAGLMAALRVEAATTQRPMPAVIILTAGGMAEARAIGADIVMRKPFDVYDLERHITRLLSQ